MLPNIQFLIFGNLIDLSTNLVLCFFSIFTSILILSYGLRLIFLKSVFICTAVSLSALIGGRLFHVIWERPEYFIKHLDQIFTKFDGMTFYGSLIAGIVSFYFLRTKLFKNYLLMTDRAVIAVSISYSILRLGCFFSGCCYGKVTSSIFAVTYYNPNSFMPHLGIPVHPVQIYDSFLGLCIFLTLIYLHKTYSFLNGKLIYVFGFLYSVTRFFTEYLRGDTFRGTNLIFGLSTSQLISVCIILLILFKFVSRHNILKVACIFLLSITSACFPTPPGSNIIKIKTVLESGIEINELQNPKPLVNLLLITLDDITQDLLNKKINQAVRSKSLPRMEEVFFWETAPTLKLIYGKIIRLSVEATTKQNISDSIEILRRENLPFDIFFLTHGMPNHLKTYGERSFFSWKDIKNLNYIPNLRLVYMASCYGTSLSQDWLNTGAQSVIGFAGETTNYVYPIFLLKNLAKHQIKSLSDIYTYTNSTLLTHFNRNRFYKKMLKKILDLTPEEYLVKNLPPIWNTN